MTALATLLEIFQNSSLFWSCIGLVWHYRCIDILFVLFCVIILSLLSAYVLFVYSFYLMCYRFISGIMCITRVFFSATSLKYTCVHDLKLSHPYFWRGICWVVWSRWPAKANRYRPYTPSNNLVSKSQRRSSFSSYLSASFWDLAGPTWSFVGDSLLKHTYVLNFASLRVMWSFDELI